MKKIAIFALLAGSIYACKEKEVDLSGYDCSSQTALTYTADIRPILVTNCGFSGCHGSNPGSGLEDFTVYANAKEHVQHAHFLGALEHNSKYEAMPQGRAKLPDSLILKIACWAKNGSPE